MVGTGWSGWGDLSWLWVSSRRLQQVPTRLGKQFEHLLPAFAQAHSLHLLYRLHLQHTICFNVFQRSKVTQCVRNTCHICYATWGVHLFLNYTLWDRFWGRFRPQIPFFRPTCMLASCPHRTYGRTFDCTWLVTSSDLSPRKDWRRDYQGPSKFYLGLAA